MNDLESLQAENERLRAENEAFRRRELADLRAALATAKEEAAHFKAEAHRNASLGHQIHNELSGELTRLRSQMDAKDQVHRNLNRVKK